MAAKRKWSKTEAEYALDHDVDERTIRRWKRLKWPLDDIVECKIRQSEQKNSAAAQKEASRVAIETKDLTDEQLENPRTQAEAKLFQLVLTCRRLAFNNRKERELYALKSDVLQSVRALRMEEWAELRGVFERELPPLCEGLNAAEIQRINGEALARIAINYQGKAEKCTG